jgi:hypothetical protein
VHSEHRQTVRTFGELHGRGPTRVDLDRKSCTVASDEVDAVDADQAELTRHGMSECNYGLERISDLSIRTMKIPRLLARNDIVFSSIHRTYHDVPTIAKAVRAERCIADELTR